MGSTRINAKGEEETIASDIQPGGYHNAGSVVENTGAMVWDGTGWRPLSGNTKDGEPASEAIPVELCLLNKEGTLDRMRGNLFNEVGLPLENRTSRGNTGVILNYNHNMLHIRLTVTVAGTGALGVSVGCDVGNMVHFLPVKTVNTFLYQIGPGLDTRSWITGETLSTESPTVTMETANAFIPKQFSIQVNPSDESPWTYVLLYGLSG